MELIPVRSQVAEIVMPERLDAVSTVRLRDALLGANGIVVLRSAVAGRTFCGGLSLRSETEADIQDSDGVAMFSDLLFDIRTRGAPVIALVDGDAFGGGVGVAAACDLVLASERSRFGLPEALYGLTPAVVSAVIADRLTPASFRLLSISCASVSSDAAVRLGLADEIVATGNEAARLSFWTRHMRRADPDAVAEVKRGPEGAFAKTLRERLDQGVRATRRALQNPSVRTRLAEASS